MPNYTRLCLKTAAAQSFYLPAVAKKAAVRPNERVGQTAFNYGTKYITSPIARLI
jgi:hypothetical protein